MEVRGAAGPDHPADGGGRQHVMRPSVTCREIEGACVVVERKTVRWMHALHAVFLHDDRARPRVQPVLSKEGK